MASLRRRQKKFDVGRRGRGVKLKKYTIIRGGKRLKGGGLVCGKLWKRKR